MVKGYIEAIKAQIIKDREILQKLKKLLPNDDIRNGYDNRKLIYVATACIKHLTGDTGKILECYIDCDEDAKSIFYNNNMYIFYTIEDIIKLLPMKPIEITKQTFIKLMTLLEEQNKYDRFVINMCPEFDNYKLYDATVNMLERLLDDKGKYIDYFIWELEFGKEWTTNSVIANGKPIPLANSSDLWDILTKKY